MCGFLFLRIITAYCGYVLKVIDNVENSLKKKKLLSYSISMLHLI